MVAAIIYKLFTYGSAMHKLKMVSQRIVKPRTDLTKSKDQLQTLFASCMSPCFNKAIPALNGNRHGGIFP